MAVIITAFLLGSAYNFFKRSRQLIKAIIPPKRMAMIIMAFLGAASALLFIKGFYLVLIVMSGFCYYITGIFSEGLSGKGIRVFSSFTMLSRLEPWGNVKKASIDVYDKEHYIKLGIYGEKIASFQYYSSNELERIIKILENNKIETTVYR